MPTQQETVFELARAGKLHASHLIPGYQTTASALLDNVSPVDLAVIGKIAAGQASDVQAAVAAARTSFESGEWSELSPAERKKIMLKWVALLEQHAEELAALDCVDAGKPITECLNTDMPATIDTFSWYAETADKCFGRISPTGSDALGLITKEPIGVVAAVLPWNFPA